MYQFKQRSVGGFLLQAMAGVVAMALAGPAGAQRVPESGRADTALSRNPGAPVMAIVSLRSQRIAVYGTRGKILEAPVSTGQTGYETPVGIYSVIEKHRDHYSNIYDDAAMPFMQRLTWSGIALHAGALPGHPASHGCIRMPHGFAGHLFELSKMGMRVLVVRDDATPVDFAHPALFRPAEPAPAEDGVAGAVSGSTGPHVEKAAVTAPQPTRRSAAATKAAAAEAAARRAEEARVVSAKARREASEFEEELEFAEEMKLGAEAKIDEAGHLLAGEGQSEFAEQLKAAKAKAQERLTRAQAKIDAIYAEGKTAIDAARAARAAYKAAQAVNIAAQNEAKLAAEQTAPVSVFISRKTQRLYVRQGFQPLFESAVTIQNPNAPIGTTIFTALSYGSEETDLRWSAVAMYAYAASAQPASTRNRAGSDQARTGPDAAKAALERIAIPQDINDRINELISPGSSLIVSDEPASRETAKGTDFVVLMSGEPQGGIRRRPRNPSVARGDDGPPGGGSGIFSWW
jgi:L,D-transpeptidase catalytic domain